MTDEQAAPATSRTHVQSIDRAAAILRCFDAHNRELGTSELARMTGLSTSTTHRLLLAMQHNDLIQQGSDRRFRLGPMLSRLAHGGQLPTLLRDAALATMTKLRDTVDETVGLHELLGDRHRVVVDQVESRQELRRTYANLGAAIALPYGAPGKAITAHLPAPVRDRCLDRPIEPITDHTVTDPNELRDELASVRERGWASSNAERVQGIRAVAAPIFDHTAAVIGALSISAPVVRMNDDRMPLLGREVSHAARQVSLALGAPPTATED